MNNSLLNISGKIDSKTVAVLEVVSSVANGLGIPFVVIGAAARDMVMHYAYSAEIQRATKDIDFGVQVSNWQDFNKLKQSLVAEGFTETTREHRLLDLENMAVDIVPFGPIKDEESNIYWPPAGDIKMKVLGFQEAFDNADWVRISDNPLADIPVAAPKGMALLKFISWMDREINYRSKDALDLAYLLSQYEIIPKIRDQIYDEAQVIGHYDWDSELAGAHFLGLDARDISSKDTYKAIAQVLESQHPTLSFEHLVEDMCGRAAKHLYPRKEALLTAFKNGYFI